MNIKQIIKEELLIERKNHLTESFEKLSNIDNPDVFFPAYIKTMLSLLEEGYEMEEIDLIVEQSFGEKVKSGATSMFGDMWNKGDIWGGIGGTLKSALKERIIRWIVSNLGLTGAFGKAVASVLADVDPRKFIEIFKSKEYCEPAAATICDGIMEAVSGFIQDKSSGAGDNIKDLLKNSLGEIIQQSNIGEMLGSKLCGVIWKT